MDEEQSSVLKVLVELVDQVTEPLNQIHESFEEFESSVWDLTRAFSSAFLGYELFEHLIEPAAEFQEEQVKLGLATNATTQQLAEFKEQAEELSDRFPSNIEQITAAQTELYKTFRDTETMKEATELAARLGVVLGVDAKQGATILASAYENLGDTSKPVGEEMNYVADKISTLVALFPMGGGGAARMAYDMSRLGAAAKTYGINVNQTFAVLAAMNRLHIGGQRGAGMFAQELIHTLAEVDSKGVPTLQQYGLQIVKTNEGHLNLIKTLEVMSKMSPAALAKLTAHLPGESQALVQLVAHIQDVKDAYGEFVNSSGEAQKASDALGKTYAVEMTIFKQKFENILDLFGTLTLPTMTKFVVDLGKVLEWLEKFSEVHPKISTVIADILLFTAAGITLFGVIGVVAKTIAFLVEGWELLAPILTIVTGLWGMLTGTIATFVAIATGGIADIGLAFGLLFESNPLGWILTGIALIGVLAYETWKHWDSVKGVINDVISSLMKLDKFFGINDASFGISLLSRSGATPPTAVAGGGFAAGSKTVETHLHYMEGATIQVDGSGDPTASAAALKKTLDGHSTNLTDILDEHARLKSRTSFSDATAH